MTIDAKLKQREYQRKYKASAKGKESLKRDFARNKQQRVKQSSRRRAKTLLLVRELKKGPCTDCGGTFDPVCMDFDHREQGTKRGGVAKLVRYGISAVRAEIAKCDLVCANCHRVRTFRKRDHKSWNLEPKMTPKLQLDLCIEQSTNNKGEE